MCDAPMNSGHDYEEPVDFLRSSRYFVLDHDETTSGVRIESQVADSDVKRAESLYLAPWNELFRNP